VEMLRAAVLMLVSDDNVLSTSVDRVKRLDQHITSHFREESFNSSTCIGTDNQKSTEKIQRNHVR